MEKNKVNLIVKKLRFSKEEYRRLYTSFEFWDKAICAKAPEIVLQLSDTELLVTFHGLPDSLVEDGTENPVAAYDETAKFVEMGQGQKIRYMGMKEYLDSRVSYWKSNYAGVRTIYVVSCFNSFTRDLELEGITFKFLGSYKQPTLLGPDQQRAMMEIAYTEDYEGDLGHNFAMDDRGLFFGVVWNNMVTEAVVLFERHKAFNHQRELWREYKARNLVEEEILN